jgi:hypothetical protein
MVEMKEKISIEFTERGVLIRDDCQISINFTAGEALMILDILKKEEKQLRKMAEEASPIGLYIRNHGDI